MASFVTIAIALFVAYCVLFGAFFAISFTIRREDSLGTLTGRAPSWVCQSARHIAGWHRSRWDPAGPHAPRLPSPARASSASVEGPGGLRA
jgi:hypothetical protein